MTAAATSPTQTTQVHSHLARLFGRDARYLLLWAVQTLCTALLTPLLTRMLGMTEFGIVTAANAAMQVLFQLASFGLPTSIQRQFAGPGGAGDARRLAMVALGLAAAVCTMGWLACPWWAGLLGMTGEIVELRLAVVWAGLAVVTNTALAVLRSADRLVAFACISLLQSVIAGLVSLALLGFSEVSARAFLEGQVATQAIAALASLALVRPLPVAAMHWQRIRAGVQFVLPLMPAAVSTFVLSTSDRFIVQGVLGSDEVARYQVAYNIGSMPMLVLAMLNLSWMPRFFSLAEPAAVLAAARDAIFRLLLPVLIGFAVGAPLILRVWAPAAYDREHLYPVVCVVVVSAIPFAAQLALGRDLLTRGRSGPVGWATAVAAVANVVLVVIGVQVLGLFGAGAATLVAYCLLHVLLRYAVRHEVEPATLPSGLVAMLVGTAVVCLGSALVPDSPAVFLARAVAGEGEAGVRVYSAGQPGGARSSGFSEPCCDSTAATSGRYAYRSGAPSRDCDGAPRRGGRSPEPVRAGRRPTRPRCRGPSSSAGTSWWPRHSG